MLSRTLLLLCGLRKVARALIYCLLRREGLSLNPRASAFRGNAGVWPQRLRELDPDIMTSGIDLLASSKKIHSGTSKLVNVQAIVLQHV